MMFHRFSLTALMALASAVSMTACGTPPKDLDLSLQHASVQQRFMVRMEPPASGPAINQMHAWQVRLSSPDGTPVSQARIAFDGGMPQHGHGFPTQPRVTREIEPGVYALDGVKFSMTGWWDMRLAIQAGGVADTAVFNVIVEPGGVKR
ncbi:FixH family protein [Piscinibacter sp.]|uniref:FixH family protein n=1 Tax=Piscinibacter sp. TaxID=1903157 RepID=UPI0035B40F3B